ncbi:MAG: YdeI/OmpD-associated family protein [Gemmatimonadota bacterium]
MNPDVFVFEGRIEIDDLVEKGYMRHVLRVPLEVAEALDETVGGRVLGEIEGVRFRRALHRDSRGRLALKFGEGWLRDSGLEPGVVMRVTLGPDPEPDRVDVPVELERLLVEHPKLLAVWESLTPGRRRSLAYPITRAKREPTRVKRAQAVLEELRRESPF